MTSAERISFLQDKLQDIRKYYMSLKSEVASIDRRRKRLKKKEREGRMASPVPSQLRPNVTLVLSHVPERKLLE